MIPFPAKTLTDLAVRIVTDIAPATSNNFAQADSGLITGLLLTIAQDYERAVHSPMADIDEIKALCGELLELPEAEREGFNELAACRALQEAQPASLMLSDVTALHAQALNLLIDIHSWAELHHESMNLKVWQLLRRHSERHKFDVPMP